MTNFVFGTSRLKADQIFEVLNSDEQRIFIESGVTHLYKKGEMIFREGGIPTGIFYVKTGRVKKYRPTPKGGEHIFYLCGKGEILGYHALLAGDYYPDSAATTEDSEIAFLPKEYFLQLLRNSTRLSNSLLRALGHEFSIYITSISNLATKNVRERLAFNLLLLEEKFIDENSPANTPEIILSRSDLANMVGTATETIVRLLQDLKKEKLIATTGKNITIIDRDGLISEANMTTTNRSTSGNE